MKLRRKIKRTTKQYIIVACICIIVIGSAATLTSIVMTSQIRNEYKSLLQKAYQEMKKNQRKVLVATKDIAPGEYLSKENVERKVVYGSQPKETYILEDSMGKAALIHIPSGTNIMKSMVTNNIVSSELRELDFDVITIGVNIANNDTVDVRIFYPNGESYVVLSKKVIKGLTAEKPNCLLWLDEEELLRISAAIVDAGMYTGAKLYLTKYIEPNIQNSSIITYTPSLSILSMIEDDPNIVERYSQELNKVIRKSLENRLAKSLETDVTSINWDINNNTSQFAVINNQNSSELKTTDFLPEPSPSTSPQIEFPTVNDSISELGDASDYLYYTEEAEAKDGEIEYGE